MLISHNYIVFLFGIHTGCGFPDTRWADYIMKSAALQSQHNMSVSGGTDRVRYFISAVENVL